MTLKELDEIRKAETVGLLQEYKNNEYIYFINDDGSDGVFKGLHNDANVNVVAPYIVCPVHTKEAWDNFMGTQEPTEPEDPTFPTLPWLPGLPGLG